MQSRCHAIELSFHEQRECWLSINWISLLYYISLHRTALYCTVLYFKSISNKYTFKTNANPYTLFLINKKLQMAKLCCAHDFEWDMCWTGVEMNWFRCKWGQHVVDTWLFIDLRQIHAMRKHIAETFTYICILHLHYKCI